MSPRVEARARRHSEPGALFRRQSARGIRGFADPSANGKVRRMRPIECRWGSVRAAMAGDLGPCDGPWRRRRRASRTRKITVPRRGEHPDKFAANRPGCGEIPLRHASLIDRRFRLSSNQSQNRWLPRALSMVVRPCQKSSEHRHREIVGASTVCPSCPGVCDAPSGITPIQTRADKVRGAKPWAARHFFLASIRRRGFFASCAAAARPFRAEPSGARGSVD